VLHPPRGGSGVGDFSLHDFAAKWMMQQDDIAEIENYSLANDALKAGPQDADRVVMIGDSISEFWTGLAGGSVGSRAIVNRGIAGQNTSQMLLRFEDDVVALAPRSVVILGGMNDLRSYVGDPSVIVVSAKARIMRNLTAMTDIAVGRGIMPVLCALPPVGADRHRVLRDAAAIVAVNGWIRDFCSQHGHVFVDFHDALADEHGMLPLAFSDDGIHPNSAGYAAMSPPLRSALATLAIR